VKLTAALDLDGFELSHIRARVAKTNNFPLTINGVTYATITGSGDFELAPRRQSNAVTGSIRDYAVEAKLENLTVSLARSNGRSVVELAENSDIIVKQPLGPYAFRAAQSKASVPIRLKIELGKKAKIERSDFTIPISGSPVLSIGEKVSTSGNIKLEPSGRIQLFGKTFIIERGQVTLNPDEPQNPRFEVVAQWRGPTHIVTVNVAGDREEAELHLSSDPALPNESMVMALLVSGSGGDSAATTAGLGIGATLFTEFMAETPLASVELRTSQDEQHANYTAAVPLKDNLWFEGTYQSTTGIRSNPATAREGFSGTLDYRFRRNWSLRTELGTLGAGADLLWQYRY
jgi:translocation and assembly module TamB